MKYENKVSTFMFSNNLNNNCGFKSIKNKEKKID